MYIKLSRLQRPSIKLGLLYSPIPCISCLVLASLEVVSCVLNIIAFYLFPLCVNPETNPRP